MKINQLYLYCFSLPTPYDTYTADILREFHNICCSEAVKLLDAQITTNKRMLGKKRVHNSRIWKAQGKKSRRLRPIDVMTLGNYYTPLYQPNNMHSNSIP